MTRSSFMLSMVLVLVSVFATFALPRSFNRKSAQLLDQRGQKQLQELLARKQRRSAAFGHDYYDDGNLLSNSLTSEEREKEGENILKRNGFITIHNKPNYRHSVRRNGSLILECDVSGTPPPSVYWLKNGEPALSQETFDNEEFTNQISEDFPPLSNEGLASTRSRYYIDCAESDDEAIYSCVAETEKDRTVSSTYVRVTGAGPSDETCDSKCKPPRIHMWSGTYVHESGKDARLICRTTEPNAHVQWYNEVHEPLSDREKYLQLSTGDLIVKRLEWGDMGGYFCRVSNGCGQDEQFTFLYPVAAES